MKPLTLLLAAVALTFWPAESAAVSIVFEQGAVVINDAVPRGEVYYFSVAREPRGYYTSIVRREDSVETDQRGSARIEVEPLALLKSTWFVFDLTNNKWAAASTGPGGPMTGGFEVRPNSRGETSLLDAARSYGDLLLIRPGKGVWHTLVRDGGLADDDSIVNGRLQMTTRAMRPRHGDEGEAGEFKPGDVVLFIDTASLQFFAERLTR